MALLAFMCLGVAVKGFSQFDISKTTLKVDWQCVSISQFSSLHVPLKCHHMILHNTDALRIADTHVVHRH